MVIFISGVALFGKLEVALYSNITQLTLSPQLLATMLTAAHVTLDFTSITTPVKSALKVGGGDLD